MIIVLIQTILLTVVLVVLVFFVYAISFLGFAPLLPVRPGEIKKIIKEIRIKEGSNICSLGNGRSGFLRVLEEHYPNIGLVGVEKNRLFYLIDKIQIFLKKSQIKVVQSDYYWADIKKFDVIYCYLSLKEIREINKKLKIDTKPDALIISNGFVVPYLTPIKTLELQEKKTWFSFLSRGKKVVRTSKDEEKRDNKIYYYQV